MMAKMQHACSDVEHCRHQKVPDLYKCGGYKHHFYSQNQIRMDGKQVNRKLQ
jgi:hypothetical protein